LIVPRIRRFQGIGAATFAVPATTELLPLPG
jgi:hypothetical protein